MKTLDCRHDQCPTPVVETRKLLLAEPGVSLTVLVGDETARENISRMAQGQGYSVKVAVAPGGFALNLTPGTGSLPGSAGAPATGRTVALIASDRLGSGNDELGVVLMKNFLITLLELDTPPEQVFFMNGGVKLTVAGSDALEALNKLSCSGVDLASCGLCLDFFGLKDRLAVGRVGNMLETVQALASAGRVIRP
jgi:selenium metabolism protein YedF